MAPSSKIRLVFHTKAFQELESMPEAVEPRAEAIAAACNAESSWGGYHSATNVTADGAVARVWSADRRNDEERDNRILRNLDAGS